MPSRVLDLFAEFRNIANGRETPCGYGLLGALAWFGLDGIDAAEKDSMRDLAIRGGPFTNDERTALLDYCEQEVDAQGRLLRAMLPLLDLDRALLPAGTWWRPPGWNQSGYPSTQRRTRS